MALIAVALFGAAAVSSAEAGQPRGVVELFTSQGCSSCPPADRVLADLVQDPDLIVMSLPVDYWDRLGWKDTFASPAFTKRQRTYSATRGDGEVYTPQAVVNGITHVNGSSQSGIERALSSTSAALKVPVSITPSGANLHVSVGSAKAGGGTVLVMPVLASRDVTIGRGENANSKVTYTNIVREITEVASWNGGALELDVPADKYKSYDSVIVLVQSGTPSAPGAILGASQVRMK